MDIDKYIEKESPADTEHDKAYAKALRSSHGVYKDMSLTELKEWQGVAREQNRTCHGTHATTAMCVVIYELIKEKEGE